MAEGDGVATQYTFSGTHRDELMGIPLPETGVTIVGIDEDRISGGKIEESWDDYDALGMLQQLGVIPAPEQAEA